MTKIPSKLKYDAIVDAVCEVRFRCDENNEAPEVVVGMLASFPSWKGMSRKRTPEASIPEELRLNDPNLVYRPTLELVGQDSSRRVKVGAFSISSSRYRSYPGWDRMRVDFAEMAECLFGTLTNVVPERVGLRYINVLQSERHKVDDIGDLRFQVTIDGEPLDSRVNINFRRDNDAGTMCSTTRIASPEFVNNIEPPDGVGVVDIDTAATVPESLTSSSALMDWLEAAHIFEKGIFFSLFSEKQLEENVEQWEEE